MAERIELDLSKFLSNQAADEVQKAGQLIGEASNSFGTGNLDLAGEKLDAGQKQLERLKPLRSLIGLIDRRIDEIRTDLTAAGLELPEGYSLELKIVFKEEEEAKKEPAAPPQEEPSAAVEERYWVVEAKLHQLPSDLSISSINLKMAPYRHVDNWRRSKRHITCRDLLDKLDMPLGEIMQDLNLFNNEFDNFVIGLNKKAALWQSFQEREIEEKELGAWEIVGEEIPITEGLGQGLSLSREEYGRDINDLHLAGRTRNALRRSRLFTIGAVLSMTERELLGIETRAFGAKSLADLKKKLAEKGYLPSEEEEGSDNAITHGPDEAATHRLLENSI